MVGHMVLVHGIEVRVLDGQQCIEITKYLFCVPRSFVCRTHGFGPWY